MSVPQNRFTLLRDMLCLTHVVVAKPLHTFARHALNSKPLDHRTAQERIAE
jgi:hypothetical protein